MPFRAIDFESIASAIPPRRHTLSITSNLIARQQGTIKDHRTRSIAPSGPRRGRAPAPVNAAGSTAAAAGAMRMPGYPG